MSETTSQEREAMRVFAENLEGGSRPLPQPIVNATPEDITLRLLRDYDALKAENKRLREFAEKVRQSLIDDDDGVHRDLSGDCGDGSCFLCFLLAEATAVTEEERDE